MAKPSDYNKQCPICKSRLREYRMPVGYDQHGNPKPCIDRWHWALQSFYDNVAWSPDDMLMFRMLEDAFYTPMENIRESCKEEAEELARLRTTKRSIKVSVARTARAGDRRPTPVAGS
jgi:hypothetical protein